MMLLPIVPLLIVSFISPFLAHPWTNVSPVVHLPGGTTIQGFVDPANPLVEQYLGVPYGASTSSSRRFAPPKLATLGATFDATKTPFGCPQVNPTLQDLNGTGFAATPVQFASTANISEDCLTAGVWVPLSASRDDRGPLPVLIFIYGGGFILGSTVVPYQNPLQWVQRAQNLIVVEIK